MGLVWHFSDTKIAKVEPSGSAGNISYSINLYKLSDDDPIPAKNPFSIGFESINAVNPFDPEREIFSLKNNEAFSSVKSIPSIASQFGEGWDYSILKAASVPSMVDGEKDSKLYAELWTDYASAGKNDYMVGGWWLLAPSKPAGDYRFGALAWVQKYYPRSGTGAVKVEVEGPATYKGLATGLHISSGGDMVSIQRLLGKVTLIADFGNATARGTISGTIDDLTLDGNSVDGQLLLPVSPYGTGEYLTSLRPIEYLNNNQGEKSDIGNIKGINYQGDWAGTFQGNSSGDDQPTGIVGVVGGSGGGNSFVASFGAKKVETGE